MLLSNPTQHEFYVATQNTIYTQIHNSFIQAAFSANSVSYFLSTKSSIQIMQKP